MKITIPSSLKKALLAAVFACMSLGATMMAADIVITAPGDQALSGWDDEGSTLTFDAASAGATVTYSANLEGFSGLTVNGDGSTLRSSAAHYLLLNTSSPVNMNINGNFTLDLGSASSSTNQYVRNLAVSGGTLNFNIAAGKTLSLYGDITGDTGANVNINNGGTLYYVYTDTASSPGTQHAGVNVTISGGSTWDLSGNAPSALSQLMLTGTITLDSGNINLMTGDVTWTQGLTLTGANSLTGATDLTLTGALDMAAGSSLDFGSTSLDASTLNFDFSALTAGDTISLSGSSLTGLSNGDIVASSHGLSSGMLGTWSFDAGASEWTLSISSFTADDLSWKGGDGQLAVGVGGWTNASGDQNLSDLANLTIGGDSIAGGTIVLDGEVEVNSLIVNGENNFILTTDAAAGASTDALNVLSTMTKNGSGTLSLAGDLALAGNKQINAGTLQIDSATAIGEGQIQIANAAILSAAAGLGTVTAWSGAVYNRVSSGYTVNVGENTTLKDNVNMLIGGMGTMIQGGGTYEVWGLTLGYTNATSNLTIAADTQLTITGETMSTSGGAGALMLSNWPVNNTLTIHGTLDSNAGFSMRNGSSATVNVEGGGELILRKGLAAVGNLTAKTININVKDGATIALANKSYAGLQSGLVSAIQFSAKVNMQDGSTLRVASETVTGANQTITVSDTINYATDASVTFQSAANVNLVLDHGINLGEGKMTTTSDGIVTLGEDVIAGSAQFGQQVNMNAGTSLMVSGAIKTNLADYAQVDTSKAISIEAGTAAAGYIMQNGLVGVTVDNIAVTTAALPVSISNSTLSNSRLGVADYSLEGTVVLDNTEVITGASLTLAADSNLTLKGSSLTALDVLTSTDTVDLTLHDYKGAATVSGVTVNQPITTLEGSDTTMTLYTLRFADLEGYQSVTLADGLTIQLDLSADDALDFTLSLLGEGVAFNFDQALGLNMEFNHINVELLSDGTLVNTYTMRGVDGEFYYIPEPSTATLSMLALVGLLARRRRKAA